MKTKITAIALSILLALIFTFPVFAGGWAVVTLDEFPTNVVAGKSFEIGFTVLQHGITPVKGMTATITGTLTGSKESIYVTAEEKGAPGHYVASLNFPKAGEWSWKIDSFGTQTLPPLKVSDLPQTAQVVNEPKPISTNLSIYSWIAGVLGSGILVAGLFMMKSKTRWAIALVLIGLIVSVAGFVSAVGQAEVKSEAQESVHLDSISQVDLGRTLFIAKGCLTCHYHEEVAEYIDFRIDAGPNLTEFSAAPEYLRMRLNDPKSVKSDTKMPKLNLRGDEIEALIAFINSD